MLTGVGKKVNCEAAAAALKELVPITAEVSVPYEFHRYSRFLLTYSVHPVLSSLSFRNPAHYQHRYYRKYRYR